MGGGGRMLTSPNNTESRFIGNQKSGFAKIGGIDFSHSLAQIAKIALPFADIRQGEAISIDLNQYDCVCSFSVFHYFKSLEYAKEVIGKMIAKAKKCVLFLDILDLETKESDIAYKKKLCGSDYSRLYEGETRHLYYPKELFHTLAKKNQCQINIEQQHIPNYENSAFRFNVIMRKE